MGRSVTAELQREAAAQKVADVRAPTSYQSAPQPTGSEHGTATFGPALGPRTRLSEGGPDGAAGGCRPPGRRWAAFWRLDAGGCENRRPGDVSLRRQDSQPQVANGPGHSSARLSGRWFRSHAGGSRARRCFRSHTGGSRARRTQGAGNEGADTRHLIQQFSCLLAGPRGSRARSLLAEARGSRARSRRGGRPSGFGFLLGPDRGDSPRRGHAGPP